jgi:DNA-binding NarL/FixJ family response regulator
LGLLLLVMRILSIFQMTNELYYVSTFQPYDLAFLLPIVIYRFFWTPLPYKYVWPIFSSIPAGYMAARLGALAFQPYEIVIEIGSMVFCLTTIYALSVWLIKKADPKPLITLKLPKVDMGPYPLYLDPEKKMGLPTGTIDYHIHVVGGTGTGKTRHVLKPMMQQDIVSNRLGVLIYDVKSNLANDIVFYCKQADRIRDFKYFDLERPEWSLTWNPLAHGTADEIANRVFCALYFESDKASQYYSELANSFLSNLITLLKMDKPVITFTDLCLATSQLDTFKIINDLCTKYKNTLQAGFFYQNWLSSPKKERHERLSGLINKLQRFCNREWSPLLNTRTPDIDLAKVFSNNNVFLFGIASQRYPDDAKALSIMMMMEISQQVAHRSSNTPEKPFRIYLDEFYNMAYSQFVNTLNKAREARVDLILAHQALADLSMISKDFAQQVSINTRTKIILTQDDSETSEFFSQLIGTEEVLVETPSYDTRGIIRVAAGLTAKKEHKFRVNPNTLKELKLGEGIVRTVYPGIGLVIRMIKLRVSEDLPKGFSFKTYLKVLNNHLKDNDSAPASMNDTLLDLKEQKKQDQRAPAGSPDPEKMKKLQSELIKQTVRIKPPKLDKNAPRVDNSPVED